MELTALGERGERRCLVCGADLADRMGVYVFVTDRSGGIEKADGLLCIEHGSNGQNTLTPAQYDYLTKEG